MTDREQEIRECIKRKLIKMTMTPWTWVQPKDQAELLARLAKARDLNVPERERENLCACAHTEIVRMVAQLEGLRGLEQRLRERYHSRCADELAALLQEATRAKAPAQADQDALRQFGRQEGT